VRTGYLGVEPRPKNTRCSARHYASGGGLKLFTSMRIRNLYHRSSNTLMPKCIRASLFTTTDTLTHTFNPKQYVASGVSGATRSRA